MDICARCETVVQKIVCHLQIRVRHNEQRRRKQSRVNVEEFYICYRLCTTIDSAEDESLLQWHFKTPSDTASIQGQNDHKKGVRV